MLRRALQPRWIIGGLLVIIAVPGMVRLGFWQLDRLDQRRVFNQRVLAQIDAPEMTLDADALTSDLYNMEFRHVSVTGQYDFYEQVVLRNQAWNNQIGFQLLAPLKIEGTDEVVLVERGWIPAENDMPESWAQFDQTGTVTIHGMLRRPEELIGVTNFEAQDDASGRQTSWLSVDLEALSFQTGYDLLPVYVQELPQGEDFSPPVPVEADIEITEGSHLGYAFQWFTFATIAGIGFPLFMYRELRKEEVEENMAGEKDQTVGEE
ncbi:MAG: SURF1 family protein [Chloroflexi bacterium]|nr:MAG: SURF1 family protein [Chloroflexota bacterium]MBL1194207.1 SURF1 family protein [Chloroflexota bacterium]NOH11500.1 SURF1 family protein [Chloroflexota bacterium]